MIPHGHCCACRPQRVSQYGVWQHTSLPPLAPTLAKSPCKAWRNRSSVPRQALARSSSSAAAPSSLPASVHCRALRSLRSRCIFSNAASSACRDACTARAATDRCSRKTSPALEGVAVAVICTPAVPTPPLRWPLAACGGSVGGGAGMLYMDAKHRDRTASACTPPTAVKTQVARCCAFCSD